MYIVEEIVNDAHLKPGCGLRVHWTNERILERTNEWMNKSLGILLLKRQTEIAVKNR